MKLTLDQMFPRKPWLTPPTEFACICGKPATTKDHFWPRYLGGASFIAGNVWRLCAECNTAKGSRFPTAQETLALCQQRNFDRY